MMKRLFCLMIAALMLLSLAACGSDQKNTSSSAPASSSAASSAPDEETAAVEETAAATEAEQEEATASADGIDVDLSTMSSTMVYSEVLNMQKTPEKYEGKVVKMKGPFNVTEANGNRYYACIVKDATACCSTGIEFVWAGDHSYPDDYPKPDEEITVVGTFTTYMEGKSRYLQLKDADVKF